jgi:hypothetical protein
MILAMLAASGAGAGLAEAWAPAYATDSQASDPDYPMVIYLGTNYDSMFKSVDGGLTYARSSAGLGNGSQVAVTAILLPAPHPGLVMAATAYWVGTSQRDLVPQGLYLSTNAGLSWFQVSDDVGATAITSLAVDSEMVVTARSADGSIQRIPLEAALFDLMRYGTPEAQKQAPLALALLGSQTGAVELDRRFWSGQDMPVTAASLAALGTPASIRTLVNALADVRETPRRHMAMQTLEYLGEKAVPSLIAALSAANPILRANAAEMLGWIASETAWPALMQAMGDEDQAVRIAAAWALTQIR